MSRRLLHGIVQGTGTTCTSSGLVKVGALHCIVVTVMVGAKRAFRVFFASFGSMMIAQSLWAARSQPQGDAGAAFLQGISGGDQSSLSVGLVGLMDVFDKCVAAPRAAAGPYERLCITRAAHAAKCATRHKHVSALHSRR